MIYKFMITTAWVFFGNQHVHSPAIDFQCSVRYRFREGLHIDPPFQVYVMRDGPSAV